MEAAAGETVMVSNTAGSTVRTAVPDTAVPSAAVIVAAPVPFAVASPCDPVVFDTVATDVLDDDHVTVLVMFWVLRSE
jgi:hypothetical protein